MRASIQASITWRRYTSILATRTGLNIGIEREDLGFGSHEIYGRLGAHVKDLIPLDAASFGRRSDHSRSQDHFADDVRTLQTLFPTYQPGIRTE